MRPLFLFFLVFAISCAANRKEAQYGKTTLPELIILKGEPIKEEPIPIEGGKILIYEDDEKFQIQNQIVTHRLRNPTIDESNLIYWKHAFKECDFIITKVSQKTEGHELEEYLMKCDALGIGVVYFDRTEMVLRVMEYEKK